MGIGLVIVGIFTTFFINSIKIPTLFKVGTIVFAASIFLSSFLTTETYLWYVITLAIATGFILSQVCCYTLIAHLAPTDRLGEYMGWMNMFFSLPQLIILIFGGLLIDNGFAPYLYITASIILLIGFVAVTQIKLPTTTSHQEN